MNGRVKVYANKVLVGELFLTRDNKTAFKYSLEWLKVGYSINPFKLPLSSEIFVSESRYFDGLFGVFADSLPDSFGELVLDRYLTSHDIDINELSSLDRLSYIGSNGMGALEYVPDRSEQYQSDDYDFDLLQEECNTLLASKPINDIDSIYSLSGSSGGARPKSLIKYDGEDYIAKFNSRFDPSNMGEIEYKYMSLASQCGINIPEIKLINTKKGNILFLIKRFDRKNNRKIHMISAAALLELDFKLPSIDYIGLMRLTSIITNNSKDDILEMYRRMVFNVYINNQDDHLKNFAFLYDEDLNRYRLSPAYDITPTKSSYGEHMTSVNGKGKNITESDMLEVAKKSNINLKIAKEIINAIKSKLSCK